ncbi:hypothetical protein ABBQ32_000184 [Trebouxia sp. C0010 RCD-2024]
MRRCIWLILLAATAASGEPSLMVQTPYIKHGSGWFYFLASGPTGTYAADHRQHCIRRLDLETGIWHEWAGLCDASPGSVDGDGNTARFNQPQGICIHPRGQLLVADKGNHCIRQITEEGSVSTYAGRCGETGEKDGGAQDALFSEVFDVQCLANCSVMVTEPGTGRVRLILDSEHCPAPSAPPGGPAHGLSRTKVWTLAIAACLTSALIGAAIALWAEAYAAKVQISVNANIEHHQALQGCDQVCLQDCEAGDHAVRANSNQHNSLMRLVPSWLGNLLPANSKHSRSHHSTTVGPNTRQSGTIAQITDGASRGALLGLKAKRIAVDQQTRITQSETAAEDPFGLFSDPQSSSSNNERQGTDSQQQQQQQQQQRGQTTDLSTAERQE